MDRIAGLKPLESIVKNGSENGYGTPTIISKVTDEEQIGKWLKKKKTIENNRSHFERQWLNNIAFLYGKQHYAISKREGMSTEDRIAWEFKSLERQKKTTRTVNYILPLYRSLLARTMMMKSRVSCSPETTSQRDVDAAKVSQELLEDFWKNVNTSNSYLSDQYIGMNQVLLKLFSFMLTICQGTLKPYYNEKALGKAVVNGEVIESEIGQVEVEVLHNFEYLRDPCRQYAFQQQVKSVESIFDQFGIEVESDDIGLTDTERQLLSLLEGNAEEKYEDSARLYQHYIKPSREFKNGHFVVFTEKQIVNRNDLPMEYKRRLPFFSFDYLNIPLAPYPQSMIEQLIPLQEDYNFTIKRINDYKKWMVGKVMHPDGIKLQSKFDDEVGQILKYKGTTGKPDFLPAPTIPQQLFEDLNRIRRDMEDIAATHDVSMSRTPAGVKSGVAINQLTEADNSQLAPQLIFIESQLSYFGQMVLAIMEEKYPEDRIVSITGDRLSGEVLSASGDKAKGNKRVEVSLGSSLPASKVERQQFIMALVKDQYITREKALELLEFGDVEGVYTDIDKQAEKNEIQEMLRGTQIEPAPYENHAVRLKVLADFMMGQTFIQLKQQNPQITDQIFNHYKMHQQILLQEQGAAVEGDQRPTPGQKPDENDGQQAQ